MSDADLGILFSAIGTLLFIFVGILVMKKQSSKAMNMGIAVGVLGIVCGAAGTIGVLKAKGYDILYIEEGGPGSMDEEDSGGGGGGGGGGGFGGGGGGGGRGGFTPSPSRELVTLVRKLEVATGDIHVQFDKEASSAMAALLMGIQEKEAIGDSEAEDMMKEINSKLSEADQAKLETFSLPRTRGRRGGGGEEGPTNPFADETNGTAIKALIERLSSN